MENKRSLIIKLIDDAIADEMYCIRQVAGKRSLNYILESSKKSIIYLERLKNNFIFDKNNNENKP